MSVEVEAKLDVPDGFVLPDLGAEPAGTKLLDATYYDAADRRLQAAGISARYRTGEDGDGGRWTVKFPSTAVRAGVLARAEHDLPGGPGEPPATVVDLLGEALGGVPLVAVVRLTTTRRTLVVRRGGGVALEVADDDVVVDGGAGRFREIEVEVGPDGDEDQLAEVVARLRAAGATDADPTPKVVRALRLLGR